MVADTRIARPIVPSPRRRGGRDASSPREPLSLRGPDVTSAPRPGGTAARLAERGPVDATSARPGGAISTVSTALTRFSARATSAQRSPSVNAVRIRRHARERRREEGRGRDPGCGRERPDARSRRTTASIDPVVAPWRCTLARPGRSTRCSG